MTTYQSIFEELKQLRNHLHGDFLIAEKNRIVELYYQVLHKQVRNLSCADCYRDAFIELYTFILKHKDDVLEPHPFVLKEGVVLHFFGESEYYTGTVPEQEARRYLRQFPAGIDKFAQYPEDWNDDTDNSENQEEVADTSTKKRGRPRKNN